MKSFFFPLSAKHWMRHPLELNKCLIMIPQVDHFGFFYLFSPIHYISTKRTFCHGFCCQYCLATHRDYLHSTDYYATCQFWEVSDIRLSVLTSEWNLTNSIFVSQSNRRELYKVLSVFSKKAAEIWYYQNKMMHLYKQFCYLGNLE